MYPVDGIRSQLEWNSTLNVSDAPVPTETTKYFRKVSFLTRIFHCLRPILMEMS
jgi:pyruvate kinase